MNATVVDGNKWIYFDKVIPNDRKTEMWDVINRRSEEPIGRIQWYASWRQYTLFPEPQTVFNDGCLDTITAFLKKLNAEHKAKVAT